MKCENCNNEHDGNYGSGRFCNRSCANSFVSKRNNKNKTKFVKCAGCGIELEVDYRSSNNRCRCNQCRRKKDNETRRKRLGLSTANGRNAFHPNGQRKKKKIKECLNCGNETTNNKFCCKKCRKEFYWIKKKKEILKNEEILNVSSAILKRFLLEERGIKCEICGIEEWMGQSVPLVMDHINGRAADNRLDNLRLVCGNCDMQLPTYKSKNKNSDRKKRVSKIL